MISHTIKVRNRRIVSIEPQTLVQDCHGVDNIVLDLDNEWDGLQVTVYLGFGKWLRAAVDDGSPMIVDVDFPPGYIPVSVVGVDEISGRKISTVRRIRGFRVVSA